MYLATHHRFLYCNAARRASCYHAGDPHIIRLCSNNNIYEIKQLLNWQTKYLIYVLTCTGCKIQYVGHTTRCLCDRLQDHISNINTKKDTNVVRHFRFLHTVQSTISQYPNDRKSWFFKRWRLIYPLVQKGGIVDLPTSIPKGLEPWKGHNPFFSHLVNPVLLLSTPFWLPLATFPHPSPSPLFGSMLTALWLSSSRQNKTC